MAVSYPISAAAKLTGIQLDTLRAWERRYRAVTPKRSARGRVYSEQQINRLLLLRQAVEQGHAIGQVAQVGDRQLGQLLQKNPGLSAHKSTVETSDRLLTPILEALDRFDYAATDREINRLAAAMASPRDFIHQAALPLMRTIGEQCHQGRSSIAQEHMLTQLLSALLASLVRIYSPTNPPLRVLFATPSDEHHAFPTLAAAMLTAIGGLGIVHLGTDLPAAEIALAAKKSAADVVVLSLSTTPCQETLEELHQIEKKTPRNISLWLGGSSEYELEEAMAGSRWIVLQDFLALEKQLAARGARF